jgi:EAL and modified HD-GYP domain-containing signal transduction protein
MNKNTKIQSLKHALNYMGEVEVKKFLALMALANLADGNPDELAVISLVRAKFCDLVSSLKRDAQNPPSGFLVGLFSLLDTLLGKDMDSLIAKLPLEEVLASALCGKDNTLKTYLNLACAFEHGDWDKITVLSNMLAIESDTLFDLYGEAVLWSSSVMTMITQPEAT